MMQSIILVIGAIIAFFIGLIIEIKMNRLYIELHILFSIIWMLIFIFVKIKIEDTFSDCIDV
jgi:hypothetical protein